MVRQEKGKRPLSAREVLGARYDWVYPALFAIGYEEGRRQTARKLIIASGNKRFGPPDDSTAATIEAMRDIRQLERLGVRLLRVGTWQELLADESE